MAQRFQTTKWSMVLAARTGTTPQSRAALSSLCEAYWYPLYAYVRGQGYDPDDASDLTQAYFLQVLEKKFLKNVDPAAGRFRSFLLVSLKNFLSKEREKARRIKRGGGQVAVPLDVETAEKLYHDEPIDESTPDRMFERRWALTLLARAEDRLWDEFDSDDKRRQFEMFKGYLTGDGGGRSYREAGQEVGMTAGAVKVAVHRLRRRFGDVLRDEIAQTVVDDDQVDGELRHLLSVTAGIGAS